MPLALRVLIGLIAGVLVGRLLGAIDSDVAGSVIGAASVIGTIFVNLIRMTVIPLVVSMLVVSIGGVASLKGLGRLGMRAGLIAVALLSVAATGSALVAQAVLARLPMDKSGALAVAGPTAPSAATVPAPGLSQWLIDLVPVNVVKAASDGAMLPLIIVTILFGLALSRAPDANREAVLRIAAGISETMQRLVAWILELAPYGVFALAVPLSARLGLSAAGAVAGYVVLVVALTVIGVALLLYPLGIMGGSMSARAFISYCAPAQAVAFASRSSLAALPVMLESADRAALPAVASRLILPLSVTLFRFGAAIAQTVGVLFLARLFEIPLSAAQIASVIVTVVVTSFAVPGIPGGSIIAMVPVLATVGLPVEGIAILLAVDTIPDMFRTTANLTGMMTLAAVLPDPSPPQPVR